MSEEINNTINNLKENFPSFEQIEKLVWKENAVLNTIQRKVDFKKQFGDDIIVFISLFIKIHKIAGKIFNFYYYYYPQNIDIIGVDRKKIALIISLSPISDQQKYEEAYKAIEAFISSKINGKNLIMCCENLARLKHQEIIKAAIDFTKEQLTDLKPATKNMYSISPVYCLLNIKINRLLVLNITATKDISPHFIAPPNIIFHVKDAELLAEKNINLEKGNDDKQS